MTFTPHATHLEAELSLPLCKILVDLLRLGIEHPTFRIQIERFVRLEIMWLQNCSSPEKILLTDLSTIFFSESYISVNNNFFPENYSSAARNDA